MRGPPGDMASRLRLLTALLSCLVSVDAMMSSRLPVRSLPRATASATEILGLEGHEASLPCDTVPPPDDTTLIVLWYRDGSDAPVYSAAVAVERSIVCRWSYDFRNRDESNRRWHNTSVFGSRVDFVPGRRPAVLTLRDLGPADQAIYKCRVDFQHSRTRNALVNLTVITAPEYVRIVNPRGRILHTVAGPFSEGDRLELICRVKGGSPRPAVTWRSGGAVLPVPYQPQGEYTVSQYSVEALDRSDLHRMVTCLASNTNLTAPATSSVMIDMNFAPLSVSILGKGEPLSAGRRYPLGNITMSTLELTPSPSHNGQQLSCRCDNPVLATPALRDSWTLAVHLGFISLAYRADDTA
ncbi:hypothetical protein FJT64_012485 [Amphibalanus amphitrite]|uniref:Ig-like domain-containing protein n=1 Tax=Amphibalanus amphitrite TaxID=1232801 RepID=A0A6A4V655_AMPAM|nr:hypothetical protein FJT64_012485 [Amphibalanus amphitrite]